MWRGGWARLSFFLQETVMAQRWTARTSSRTSTGRTPPYLKNVNVGSKYCYLLTQNECLLVWKHLKPLDIVSRDRFHKTLRIRKWQICNYSQTLTENFHIIWKDGHKLCRKSLWNWPQVYIVFTFLCSVLFAIPQLVIFDTKIFSCRWGLNQADSDESCC